MKEKDTEFIQHTANNLKAIRTNTGVSREAIAEYLGITFKRNSGLPKNQYVKDIRRVYRCNEQTGCHDGRN
jgi:hypothetical protein